jgi:hypothetical protein
MKKELFIVGKYISGDDNGNVSWELMGVFDNKEKAVEVAKKDENYFYGPVNLNEELKAEKTEWRNCVYPNSLCSNIVAIISECKQT